MKILFPEAAAEAFAELPQTTKSKAASSIELLEQHLVGKIKSDLGPADLTLLSRIVFIDPKDISGPHRLTELLHRVSCSSGMIASKYRLWRDSCAP